MTRRSGYKRAALVFVLVLIGYLSLYTWNLKTGILDRLATRTGLEFTGHVLWPGEWVRQQALGLWSGYVDLVDVREENERLHLVVHELISENVRLREQAASVPRLERLLGFAPAENWTARAARVIGQKLGPTGALGSVLVDLGEAHGFANDAPAVIPEGVVGRVLRTSPNYSTVLLLTDQNSRVAVMGSENRTTAILSGGGPDELFDLKYVPVSGTLSVGELLVTSGLDGIFPKGLPVARVVRVEQPDVSLFQSAQAEPLFDVRGVEELFLLARLDGGEAAEDIDGGQAAARPMGAPPEVQLPPEPDVPIMEQLPSGDGSGSAPEGRDNGG